MDKIQLKALAKINLGLDVLRRREDGYHEVKMIMQTISLYDELMLKKIKKPEIQLRTNLPYLPTNENNLAYQAAKLLMEEYQIPGGLLIQLEKKIPVAAGMAGGSSDAAAVLWGVNQMYHLGLSRKELMERGVRLGADVPYCILRGTALAEGIGEKLKTLPPMPKCYLLIAKPGISVSTKFVYENLHVNELETKKHPDVDAMITALRQKDLALLSARMGNILELVTIPAHPVIDKIKQEMQKAGALGAMMSGSGPTVFGIFDTQPKARKAYRALRASQLAKQLYLTVPYNVHRV
ncbi:MAG: 4-(cytidine 5'-diphospho)-2-C-methyl-D-erythritol kinase [Lachnospiraceae bacterium]|jgi:4-diphosphocytidyl-2-C-methyl-D-erythritol kinase|nr:4-(cytidine 5'-diphospho)-2-C-methyl-D-erythritol kinase [Lachnospiraceae bacterium]